MVSRREAVERELEDCESFIHILEESLEQANCPSSYRTATRKLQDKNAHAIRLRAQLRSIDNAQDSRKMP